VCYPGYAAASGSEKIASLPHRRFSGNPPPSAMHERPFVENLLKITLRHAQRAGARRVLALNLVIGQMSSIVDDSVQFYWDLLSRGTIAEGAHLNFRRLPAVYRCLDCGHRYPLDGQHLACPRCGSVRVQLIQGDEFRLESIDIEETDRGAPSSGALPPDTPSSAFLSPP